MGRVLTCPLMYHFENAHHSSQVSAKMFKSFQVGSFWHSKYMSWNHLT